MDCIARAAATRLRRYEVASQESYSFSHASVRAIKPQWNLLLTLRTGCSRLTE